MISIPLNDTTEDDDVKLFIEGVQIVFNQFDSRIGMDEAANVLFSISVNMFRHMMDHSIPGLSNEELHGKLRDELNHKLTSMEKEVWNLEQ
jgi:hypothetical protein